MNSMSTFLGHDFAGLALAALIAFAPAVARADSPVVVNSEKTASPMGVEAAVPVPYVAPSIGARELAESASTGVGRGRGAAAYSLSDAIRDSKWRRATAKRLDSLYENLSRF